MAYSESSTGDTSSMASSRRYLSSSAFANAASSKAETKMGEKKGKNAGLFNSIRFRFWGRNAKHVKKVDQVALMDREDDISEYLTRYSYEQLHVATEGFSHKLGEGGFGVVYKGILSMMVVAVKMIVGGSQHQLRDYISEIKVIGRLRHPNLVRLLGYCHEGEHLLLVHEFMANGSLSSHLHGSELPALPWEVRYRIAAGLASALSYLQNGGEWCVVHRDIKPSNILLDSDFNPKLTDFDLARFASDNTNFLRSGVITGTMGYIAPEFYSSGQFSKESDIYAFGVVLLEIASGRRPFTRSLPKDIQHLVSWVSRLSVEGKTMEAADPKLGNAFNELDMRRLLNVGLLCCQYDPQWRPSIEVILKFFKNSETPPHNILPKEEISSITPPITQQGMMPYFLSDVEDCTTICFELTSTAAAESAGGSTVQADTVASATSSSTISESDRESASRASSNSVLTCDPDEQKLQDASADQGRQSDTIPVLVQDDHQLELEAEAACWDIGIPPTYLSAGDSPMQDHHHPVINGFVGSLHNLLQSKDKPIQFDEVLKLIEKYTSCLVSVGAPLVEWNSLAQEVLRVSQMMNAFPTLITPKPTAAATLSSLRANVNECAHAVDDYEARSEYVHKQLALARKEHLALTARIAELEKQIEESEEELNSVKQNAAQRRELQGKLSTILNQYESTLSKLSSFTCAL